MIEEATDVIEKDEGQDVSYSNMKLSNTRLVQAFPGRMTHFAQKFYFFKVSENSFPISNKQLAAKIRVNIMRCLKYLKVYSKSSLRMLKIT